MNDFEKTGSGELHGFDSAKESERTQNGYTVTPEGGFYSHSKQDIIQDNSSFTPQTEEPPTAEASPAQPQTAPSQTDPAAPRRDFFPNGQYGGYAQSRPVYQPPVYPPVTAKKPKSQKGVGWGAVIVAILLAAVVGAGSAFAVLRYIPNTQTDQTGESTGTIGQNVNINIDKTAESVVEAVAQKVTPSVVGIRTTTSVISFFGGSSESTGEGSGVVYSKDGYIITNYHVISGAVTNKSGSKIEVFIDSDLSSKSYEATVVGYNISSDLAVVKINAKGLTPVEITDSDKLNVGQYVITVGNPGGLEFMDSVTYGVISGLDRVVSSSSDISLIQTDAAINPGNSGGALVNVKGQLVGINSSKIVSEEFEGMGFAIPSNTVVKVCEKIIANENSPEPYLGITVSEKYTASVLQYYGYPVGAVVLSVDENSPAALAGLQKGDIITAFNGTEIQEYTMLEDLLKDCRPDSKVNIKIYRSGRYYTTSVTIGSNNSVN